MARKNRMSVYDGVYHVTTRIAHRAMLLGDDSVKDEVLARAGSRSIRRCRAFRWEMPTPPALAA